MTGRPAGPTSTPGPLLPGPPLAPEAAARRLNLEVARRLDGLLHGDHPGFLPGPGSEPAEARAYSPGDDVRRIDWAVTARTGQAHVRSTVAERELETTLLVDLSASMSFGTANAEKRDVALALSAAFLHLTSRPGDRTGALTLTGEGLRVLPARSGRAASVGTLTALLRTPRSTGPGPGLAHALTALSARPRRRGLTVVVGDLLQPVGEWARPLRLLALRHDVIVCQVVDRRELRLPAAGVLSLVDPATGRQLQVRTTPKVRERYAEAARARAGEQAAAVRAAPAGHLVVHTEHDWLPQLARFLTTRHRTRGRVG